MIKQMYRNAAVSLPRNFSNLPLFWLRSRTTLGVALLSTGCWARRLLLLWAFFLCVTAAKANVLWTDLGATLAHDTGVGGDILGGTLKRDDTSSDTLYFKFHVDPLSDASTEEYFAAFELYEGGEERLGVGNALKAWAYTAFKADANGQANDASYIDLNSSRPEPSGPGTFYTSRTPPPRPGNHHHLQGAVRGRWRRSGDGVAESRPRPRAPPKLPNRKV